MIRYKKVKKKTPHITIIWESHKSLELKIVYSKIILRIVLFYTYLVFKIFVGF